jgi:hypothetical protein
MYTTTSQILKHIQKARSNEESQFLSHLAGGTHHTHHGMLAGDVRKATYQAYAEISSMSEMKAGAKIFYLPGTACSDNVDPT